MIILKFKNWLHDESIFGQPVDEPVPDPEQDKRSNGAFPDYQINKCKKKMKKNQSSSSSSS